MTFFKKISTYHTVRSKTNSSVGIGRVRGTLPGQLRDLGSDVGSLESTVNLAGGGPPWGGSAGQVGLCEGAGLRTAGPLPARPGLGAQRWAVCRMETWPCLLLGAPFPHTPHPIALS